MTIKLDNPKIEEFFIREFQSNIEAFSEFILRNIENYKKENALTKEEIDKIVDTSQMIEGYKSVSKELELEVEEFMLRNKLEVSV